MASIELRPPVDWRRNSAIALLAVGIALVGLSFVWANWATGRSAWSDQQALDFQAASAKLHSLSHEFAHHGDHGNTDALRPKLEEAQERFGELRTQLESAQNRPARIAMIMRFAGLLLAVAGGAIYVTRDRVSLGK